jgi:hypothetical protein
MILFGVRGQNARTLQPGRTQPNVIVSRKREHSRKPDEQYEIIEACSWGPFLELFARGSREGWTTWGNQADEYTPDWSTYKNHSQTPSIGSDEVGPKQPSLFTELRISEVKPPSQFEPAPEWLQSGE